MPTMDRPRNIASEAALALTAGDRFRIAGDVRRDGVSYRLGTIQGFCSRSGLLHHQVDGHFAESVWADEEPAFLARLRCQPWPKAELRDGQLVHIEGGAYRLELFGLETGVRFIPVAA